MLIIGGHEQRGQSELLGIVLLFALVLTVSMTVVVVGSSAISNVQSDTMIESAEQTMLELQSKATQAGSSRDAVEEVSFVQSPGARPASDQAGGVGSSAENAGDVTVAENEGKLTIEVMDSGGSSIYGPTEIKMGKITYQREGRIVAYQGGGVFQKNTNSGSSTIVSPPNFQYQYRNGVPTLSMPVTTVTGSISDDEFSLQQSGTSRELPGSGFQNPLKEGETLRVTVKSEYYQAWARLFRERTDGTVTVDEGNNEVTLKLGAPEGPVGPVRQAVVAGSGSSITNVGHIDSYDSESGGYPDSLGPSDPGWPHRQNGDVRVNGPLDITVSPSIAGDLVVDGEFHNTNHPTVYGKTVIGGTAGSGDPTHVENSPEYKGDFSTKDDININRGSGAIFGGDVVVGGSVVATGGGDAAFGGSEIGGNLHIHGDVPELTTDQIQGSVHVGGDLDLDHDSDPVQIDGDIYAAGDVEVGDQITFTDSDPTIHAGGTVTFHDDSNYDVDVVAGGDVHLGQSGDSDFPTINGDIDSGDDVYLWDSGSDSAEVTGTITAENQIYGDSDPSWTEGGNPPSPTSATLPAPEEPDVPTVPSVKPDVENARTYPDATDADLDPGAVSDMEGGGGCSPCVIEGSGNYGFDQIQWTPGETVRFKPDGGTINLHVDGTTLMRANIEVVGSGHVKVLSDDTVTLATDLNVDIQDDDSSQFRVLVHPSADVDTWGSPEFVGVINGAGGSADDGAEIDITNDFEIYGAVIGDVSDVNSNPGIHFDEALISESASGGGPTAGPDTVSYIQIRTTTIEASD